MLTRKSLIVTIAIMLLSTLLFGQVYRTKDQQYSIRITDFKQSDKISLTINLYQSQPFNPWLTKFWDNQSKSWCYGSQYNRHKFYLWPVRDSNGTITQLDLAIFYHANGFNKPYTEFLFNDTYYKSK